ncbi:MAG: hypothetical protein WBV82_13030 [Myxococcaceae bacterium]
MRVVSRLMLCGVMALAAAGCGGSDPGTGSRTLWVKAEAVTDGSTDGTELFIQVRQGGETGEILTDAVVTIEGDKTGEFAVPWTGIKWGDFAAGGYLRDDFAWDTGWRISVKRGSDDLVAYIEAPGVTEIGKPLANTTYRRSDAQPLVVQWRDTEGRRAELVEVDFQESNEADRTLNEDPGELEIEYNRLEAKNDERLEVRRRNEINLEGGVVGSTFRATTRHTIRFNIE